MCTLRELLDAMAQVERLKDTVARLHARCPEDENGQRLMNHDDFLRLRVCEERITAFLDTPLTKL